MQGTNKQIEWAEQIKADLMPVINMRADQFRKQAAAAKDGGGKVANMIDKAMAIIGERPASYWIDNRGDAGNAVKTAHIIFAAAAKEATA